MTDRVRAGVHYLAAAMAGLCFGVLIGGAVVFVTQASGHTSAEELHHLEPVKQGR